MTQKHKPKSTRRVVEEVLEKLNDLKVTGSKIDVHKLYTELIILDKHELTEKVIHLTLCVEGLGNVIGSLNDVMHGVAHKLNSNRPKF